MFHQFGCLSPQRHVLTRIQISIVLILVKSSIDVQQIAQRGKGKIKCRTHSAQVLDSPARAINQNLNTAIIILVSVKPMEDFVKLVTPEGALRRSSFASYYSSVFGFQTNFRL